MKEKTKLGNLKLFLVFAGPASVLFALVVLVPFLYGIFLTFTNWDGFSSAVDLVGLRNYQALFQDGAFWESLGKTILYVLCSVLLINFIAFVLAYLLTSGLRGQGVMRSAFFTPNLIGGIILGFIWQFVFNKSIVAVGEALHMDFLSSSWLSDPAKAFWAMVIVTVWQYSGYMMIIYVAGFTGIPNDLIEASKIDGCTAMQTTRKVVLPLMVPSFVICLFLSVQRCFMVYDVNLALTNGGPENSTRFAAMFVYQKAFTSQEYGVGQAEAIVLFLIVAVITMVQTYLGKRKEVDA